MKIAFCRGLLVAKPANGDRVKGAMMAVNLPEEEIQPFLAQMARQKESLDVAVACVNSPRNITLSGCESQISEMKCILDRARVSSTRLKVNVAYHSKAMDEIAHEYGTMINDITVGDYLPHRPSMISSVTGTSISAQDLARSTYWVQNLTGQVWFSQALSKLCQKSPTSSASGPQSYGDTITVTDIVELGPHSTLKGSVNDVLELIIRDNSITYSSVLKRNVSAITSSMAAMGHLHCQGHSVRLDAINDAMTSTATCQVLADLPQYPFNHSRSYWAESRLSRNYRLNPRTPHELLGVPALDCNPTNTTWRQTSQLQGIPWMADHKVRLPVVLAFLQLKTIGQWPCSVPSGRTALHGGRSYPSTGVWPTADYCVQIDRCVFHESADERVER